MAEIYDLEIEQGATFQRTITWKDRDGDPVDLTGYSARMQIRKRVNSDTTLAEATTENGYITLGDAEGTIAISIPANITEDFDFRRAVYDLELESANGTVYRVLQGCVYLSREVTR